MSYRPQRMTLQHFVELPGATLKQVRLENAAAGDNTLYTCPAGKRAVVVSIECANYSGGGTGQFTALITPGGGASRFIATTTTAVISGSGFITGNLVVLDAGETLIGNSGTVTAPTFLADVIEFDVSGPLRSIKFTSPVTGDNTIYTCPPGKRALILPLSLLPGSGTGFGTLSLGIQGTGTLTHYFNAVPSGGTPGSGNRISGTAATVSAARASSTIPCVLYPGDYLNWNVSDPSPFTIMLFFTVLELPL